MTQQEFIDQILSIYKNSEYFEMDSFDDDDEVEEDNDKGLDLKIIIPDDVEVTFNSNDTFNIRCHFYYPAEDENFGNLHLEYIEKETRGKLSEIFHNAPEDDYDCGMCSDYGDVISVGYSDLEYSLALVSQFVDTCNKTRQVKSHKVFEELLTVISPVIEANGFYHISNTLFSNARKTSIIFTGELTSLPFEAVSAATFHKVSDFYNGRKYCFVKPPDGRILSFHKQLLNCFNLIVDKYNLTNLEIFSDYEKYLYIKAPISAIISAISLDGNFVQEEYDLACKHASSLKTLDSTITTDDLYFSHLTPISFEQLCHDLLSALGFADTHLIGNTHAPDGGVDIIAIEKYPTLFEEERRKWIWQCKHH